jgi:opacity protein-like surface antigen
MRVSAAGVLVLMAFSGAARAQSPAPPGKEYVEAVAQSAFGNVTSQSFGGEFGITVLPRLQIFLEAGQVRDAAPDTFGLSAQMIAGFLSHTQSNVAFRVKQPVTFGLAGGRFAFPLQTSRLEPYVVGGAGIARVNRDATFTLGGTDVTSSLTQFGVTLGTDLSGSETRPMLTLGGGVAWPVWTRLVVDLQYRYGRVFIPDAGLNINRAGVGIGVRF